MPPSLSELKVLPSFCFQNPWRRGRNWYLCWYIGWRGWGPKSLNIADVIYGWLHTTLASNGDLVWFDTHWLSQKSCASSVADALSDIYVPKCWVYLNLQLKGSFNNYVDKKMSKLVHVTFKIEKKLVHVVVEWPPKGHPRFFFLASKLSIFGSKIISKMNVVTRSIK